MGTIIVLWGTMTTMLGTVNNFSQLVAVRFLYDEIRPRFFGHLYFPNPLTLF